MNTMRQELEPLPPRMQKLPIDKRGFPVPWFVAWVNDEPEFRAMDRRKFIRAVKEKLCWCCGEPLGKWKAFVIGPMCGINRTSGEPPSHLDCAQWSARNCPFLTQRQMKRRESEELSGCPMAGHMIKRNPGVIMVWVTTKYTVFHDDKGAALLNVGNPERIEWFSHGRTATRAEIVESVNSGIPSLLELCTSESDVVALKVAKESFETLYPIA